MQMEENNDNKARRWLSMAGNGSTDVEDNWMR